MVVNYLYNVFSVSCVVSEGGIGGPEPPDKSQVIWVSIEISIWTPHPWKKLDPLEHVGPPLVPRISIDFSVIKPLDPLCKLYNELRIK